MQTPVGRAIASLAELRGEARWLSLSELLGRMVIDRGMLEAASAIAGVRARD